MSLATLPCPTLDPEAILPLVRSLAKRYRVSEAEREDLIQEGWFKAVIVAKEYDPTRGSTFNQFVATCALCRMSSAHRASRRWYKRYAEACRSRRSAHTEDPSVSLDIAAIMGALNDQERAIVSLRLGFTGDRLTWEEIGESEGISRHKAQRIFGRALASLRLRFRGSAWD